MYMIEYDLRNKNANEILDTIVDFPKNKSQLKKQRNKILKLLDTDIELDNIKKIILVIKKNLPEEIFIIESYEELQIRLVQFMKYLVLIPEGKLYDGGYSLLISYYFYITEELL